MSIWMNVNAEFRFDCGTDPDELLEKVGKEALYPEEPSRYDFDSTDAYDEAIDAYDKAADEFYENLSKINEEIDSFLPCGSEGTLHKDYAATRHGQVRLYVWGNLRDFTSHHEIWEWFNRSCNKLHPITAHCECGWDGGIDYEFSYRNQYRR